MQKLRREGAAGEFRSGLAQLDGANDERRACGYDVEDERRGGASLGDSPTHAHLHDDSAERATARTV